MRYTTGGKLMRRQSRDIVYKWLVLDTAGHRAELPNTPKTNPGTEQAAQFLVQSGPSPYPALS